MIRRRLLGKMGAAFAALVLCAVPATAQTLQPFQPLRTVMDANNSSDPGSLEYVSTRCAAIYVAFAAMLKDETDPERVAMFKQFVARNETYQMAAVAARMHGTTTTMTDAAKTVGQIMTRISLLYMQRINDAKARTNNMFSDPLIADDFSICKGLVR